jgi:glycosyltransferase involved in cell wall biosynthesis
LQRGYEFIMEMDGDFSHDPDDIPRFIEAAQEADLVLGSRYCHGIRVINWPMKRLLLSTSAARYVRWITGMPFSDPTGGFKCFRRRALASIDLDKVRSNGYSFQIEIDAQALAAGDESGRDTDHFHRPFSRHFQDVAQNRLGGAGDGVAAVVPKRPAPIAFRPVRRSCRHKPPHGCRRK